jgi:putative aldouronate transport system permease protein
MAAETLLQQDVLDLEGRTASRGRGRTSNFLIHLFLAVMALTTLFPFYIVIITSFGSPTGVLLPTKLDMEAYRFVIEHSGMLRAFGVSFGITIIGTFVSMLVTTCLAYSLSKRYPYRNGFLYLIIFTMFFGGGLIPYYLTVKNVGLVDSYMVMVLPMAVNAFYMMIMLSFFREYPESLEESAKIDGAGDFAILMRIVIPTSKPVLAAMSLFYAVDRWNEWWHPLLFIQDPEKYPLQLLTRQLIINYQTILDSAAASVVMDQVGVLPDSMKMAVIIVNVIPIMLVYPFLQKYFAKGVLLGSMKE